MGAEGRIEAEHRYSDVIELHLPSVRDYARPKITYGIVRASPPTRRLG